MNRAFRAGSGWVRVAVPAALALGMLPALSYAAPVGQAKPVVSAPFVVAGGEGNQSSPSVAGNIVAYDNCPDAWGNCKVMVANLVTKQTYPVGTSYFYGQPETDGVRVVWKDSRNKTSDDVYSLVNNIDVFAANLADGVEVPVSLARNLQDEPQISGNVVVWADYRRMTGPGQPPVSDIYMFDLSTGKERLIAGGGNVENRHPVTNGRVVVWERDGDLYGYDIASARTFIVSQAPSAQVMPAIYNTTVVWEDYRNAGRDPVQSDIYGYDLSSGREFVVTRAGGRQSEPSIWGNIVVYNDDRNVPVPQGPGPMRTEVYGYDLATKQEFPVVVGGTASHVGPKVSGNLVVWEEDPSGGWRDGERDVMGATISGIGTTPPPANPQPQPGSRSFPQTRKTVSGIFLDYWLKNGGLAQQGYPISEVMTEVSDLDGKQYRVQYFERAVFEEHPEKQPPYNVLLSQLGTFQWRKQHADLAAAPPGPKPGSISGRLMFPSEGIPAMYVYALPVGGQVYFVARTWSNQQTFTIDGVKPGTYHVVASPVGASGGGLLFAYTKAVQCGLTAGCDDHTFLEVTVRQGQATRGIDPTDTVGNMSTPFQAPPPPVIVPPAEGRCYVFEATTQMVCGDFLQYWMAHGGLAQQGYPLGSELEEVSPLDGKRYTVQYFERAVFEHHPEKQPPYNVLLSQLGTFRYKDKYGGRP